MDNEIIKNVLKQITYEQLIESGLSRVYQHIQQHDIAIISAARKYIKNCYNATDENNVTGLNQSQVELPHVTKTENQQRTRDLYSILISLGYSITKSQGVFIEDYLSDNSIEVKENSFFVVNIHDDPAFKDNIINLGMYFCQDSVLFKDKNSKEAVLIGTNNSEYPGLNNVVKLGKLKTGITSELTTKIGSRPFTFSEAADHNIMARGMMKKIGREILKEINFRYRR